MAKRKTITGEVVTVTDTVRVTGCKTIKYQSDYDSTARSEIQVSQDVFEGGNRSDKPCVLITANCGDEVRLSKAAAIAVAKAVNDVVEVMD